MKIALLMLAILAPLSCADDWPMLAHDAARSGASPDTLKPPFERKWYRLFADEGIQSGVQPIVAGNTVYIGTLSGKLYALDAESGTPRWTFTAGGPILHTAAASNGRVIFGAADGVIYALEAKSGDVAWKVPTDAAVWNAPACADGRAFVGGRDNFLYCIDIASGNVLWRGDCSAPLLNSPAIDTKSGRVVIGAEDMRVHAFALADGKPLWTSPKLPGCSLRGYHPVVAPGGQVLITTQPVAGYDRFQDLLVEMSRAVFGDIASWRIKSADEKKKLREKNFAQLAEAQTFQRELEWLRERLGKETGFQTFFILNGADGTISARPPIVASESMNGPGAPPLLASDGRAIVKFQAVLRSRYEHYSPFLNPGWLDSATGALTPLMAQDRTFGWHDSLLLVHDEQSQLSLAGTLLLNTHQDNINALDLTTLKGNPSPLAINIHEPAPGQAAALRLATFRNRDRKGAADEGLPAGDEWLIRGTAVYGGGSVLDVPVSISGDSFYFLPTHELSSGCALIAYRMKAGSTVASPQKRPRYDPKAQISPEEWVRIQGEPWDWDTLATSRLKSFLDSLPGAVPGTSAAPLWDDADKTLASITDAMLDETIWQPAFDPGAPVSSRHEPLQKQLSAAVSELISKTWRPFHFPGGKAPQEGWLFFRDPAHMLTTLLLARPFVDENLRAKLDAAIAAQASRLQDSPRELPAGDGAPREQYDVPTALLKLTAESPSDDLARVYPLWLRSRLPDGAAWAKEQWPKLRNCHKIQPPKDSADAGNAHVAGLIAYCRLAKLCDDTAALDEALPLARQAMRERLRYEFAYTRGGVLKLAKSGRSLAVRWHNLTPDVAALLARHAQPICAKLIENYIDKQRPAWWIAWNVESLWANEVPFQLPCNTYDLFAAKALLASEPREKLAKFADIPWCAGDEYYIRKLALAVRAK